MSHRMCGDCNGVVDNRCYHKDYCPKCKSTNWANPNENNNEWQIIYDLQIEVILLKAHICRECKKVGESDCSTCTFKKE